MIFNAQFDTFGKMELMEVYEFYDKPLLVACKSISDHLYFAVLIDENSTSETWLYVPVSLNRFQSVRSGAIELYEAFKQTEDGKAYIVSIPHDASTETTFSVVDSLTLSDDMLPVRGERLNYQTQTLPERSNDLKQKATQTKRELVSIRLNLSDQTRTEAPAQLLGEVLTTFQRLVTNIVTSQRENAKVMKKAPAVSSEMNVVAFEHGSFEVDMASTSSTDLFDESEVGRAIAEAVRLIGLGSNTEELHRALTELKVRVAASYLQLLKPLSERVSYTTIEWASPKEGFGNKSSIEASVAQQAIKIIETANIQEPSEFMVVGKLIGASLRSKFFELLSEETGKPRRFRGQVSDQAMEFLNGASLGKLYRATIRRTVAINLTTSQEESTHTLVRLDPP